jgi:glycosyltransferase involved in cell wall biosynthesis
LISVLHFSSTLARGGVEEHILTLLRGLDRSRFRLYLVCTPLVARLIRNDLPSDVRVFPLCLRKPYQVSEALRLARFIRENKIDILHSHLFYSSLFASPIAKACGVSLTIETPHIREHWRHGLLKSHFFVDRFVGHLVDRYIAVSQANARYLIEEKKLPRSKIRVIRNGCDIRHFNPRNTAPPGMKSSLGFEEDDPILLVLGRLESQKGHCFLLTALQKILDEFPKTKLVCLGEGSLRRKLEEMSRDLRLEHAVRFVGFQANVADWLALADVTVLPSLYEGLPIAALESLAAGRPVVASSVDGTIEVVLHGKTGFTVPPEDSDRLAEGVLRLLRNPELRCILGQAGRQWVLDHFTVEQQIRQTEQFYLEAFVQKVTKIGTNENERRDSRAAPITGSVDG